MKVTSGLNIANKILKYILLNLNILFLVFGLMLILIGTFLCVKYKHYFSQTVEISIVSVGLSIAIIGAVVCFLTFLGCIGSYKENRCMIITFSTISIIAFVLELVVFFTAFAMKDRFYGFIENDLLQSINSTKMETMQAWNYVQTELHCCGFSGPNDWKIHRSNSLPASCCQANLKCPHEQNPAYSTGCYDAIVTQLKTNLMYVWIVVLVLICIQIFSTLFACLLAKSIKNTQIYKHTNTF